MDALLSSIEIFQEWIRTTVTRRLDGYTDLVLFSVCLDQDINLNSTVRETESNFLSFRSPWAEGEKVHFDREWHEVPETSAEHHS